jgi:reductive dehalogenase
MFSALKIINSTFYLIFTCTFLYFSLLSFKEKEIVAAKKALLIAFLTLIFGVFTTIVLPEPLIILILSSIVLAILILLLSFLPILNKNHESIQSPNQRKDERDIPFSRIRLEPGTPQYQQYYTLHPENEPIDQRTRSRPGLSSPKSLFNHPLSFAATDASYFLTEHLRLAAQGTNTHHHAHYTPQEASAIVKSFAQYYGALEVGITELKPEHTYTHIGRGVGNYGDSINLHQNHTFAIAFTVEMDHTLVKTAPQAPSAMESAHQYVEAGRIATQLAAFIRNLGYQARAHVDGNYQVIAPLIARDAGLGEIGRNSILITPKKGPRVRLGVVTTDLPLITDKYQPNHAVLDFCRICKKCATNCPSRSISLQNRVEVDGALQWKIDPITCFNYWNTVGTDCGLCMSVCPFAHPDTPAHNFIRYGIQHSALFRRLALLMDDFFYQKKPLPHPIPAWLNHPDS